LNLLKSLYNIRQGFFKDFFYQNYSFFFCFCFVMTRWSRVGVGVRGSGWRWQSGWGMESWGFGLSFYSIFLFSFSDLSWACDTRILPEFISNETYVVMINFTGGEPQCLECLQNISAPGSETYSPQYACGNGDGTWEIGNWNGGQGSFHDPTPEDSYIVMVEMELWGIWDIQRKTQGLIFCSSFSSD
jgi:hypothetical protein